MNNFNHEVIEIEIKGTSPHLVWYFHVFIDILIDNLKPDFLFDMSWDGELKYEFLSLDLQKRFVSPEKEIIIHWPFHLNQLNQGNQQKLWKIVLKNDTTFYPTVQINEMIYLGWKSYSCQYGGLSFHEDNQEILSLCGNYTLLTKPFSRKSDEGTSHGALPLYTASSQVLLLALRSRPSEFVSLNMSVSVAICKGIFLNPCSDKDVVAKHNVMSQLENDRYFNGTCLSFQFSLKFFQDITPNNTNRAAIGCHKVYKIRSSNNTLCLNIRFLNKRKKHSDYVVPSLQRGNSLVSQQNCSEILKTACKTAICL